MLAIAAAILLLAGAPTADPALVGEWTSAGERILVLNSDGTGSLKGSRFHWSAADHVVEIETAAGKRERMPYAIHDGELAMVAGGVTMRMRRADEAGHETATASAADPGSPEGLRKLLVANAWCSFHDLDAIGVEMRARIVYRPDGTWSKQRRRSASDAPVDGGSGTWKMRNGQLYLTTASGDTSAVQLFVKTGPDGVPTLIVNGEEWLGCK